MRHKHDRLSLGFLLKRPQDHGFVETVQIACRFIEQHERRVMEERPRKADQLPLAAMPFMATWK